jgi:prepilin-type N-terminal cleavage/methylation domain-containing protein
MIRNHRRALPRDFRSAVNGQAGFSLIEVLVALGILAMVAVIFLVGMSTSSRAVIVSQERVTADSLAKAEMEYVKGAEYHTDNSTWSYQLPSSPPAWDPTHNLTIEYTGYSLEVAGSRPAGHTYDDGIQEITITVSHNGEIVTTVTGFKVNR